MAMQLELFRSAWAVRFRVMAEGIWKNPWFGWFLIGVSASSYTWWCYHIPLPAKAATVLGFIAAVMVFRGEPEGYEKFFWTIVLFSFLLLEIGAIDHKDHLDELARQAAETRETKSFGDIGEGINKQSRQSEEQFEETVKQQRADFDATMRKSQEGIRKITKVESNTETLLASVEATHANVMALSSNKRALAASGDAWVGVTTKVTRTLRDFQGRWSASIQNDENMEWAETHYRQPALSEADAQASIRSWEGRKEQDNAEYRGALNTALDDARTVQRALLYQITGRTQEDTPQSQFLEHYADNIASIRDAWQCSGLDKIADYLDGLAKRAKAALGD